MVNECSHYHSLRNQKISYFGLRAVLYFSMVAFFLASVLLYFNVGVILIYGSGRNPKASLKLSNGTLTLYKNAEWIYFGKRCVFKFRGLPSKSSFENKQIKFCIIQYGETLVIQIPLLVVFLTLLIIYFSLNFFHNKHIDRCGITGSQTF